MAGIHKLTAAHLKTTEPGRYADGGGLYLQITPGPEGPTRSWLFRYMLDGHARQMGLGPTHTVPLVDARERARQARALLLDRIDPIEARLAERDARRADEAARITFKDAALRYIEVHESGWRNDKHKAQWKSTLETYAFPQLGARPVSAIDAAVINATLAPIWTTKAETATRTKGRVERVIEWVKSGMPLPAPSKTRRVKHHAALPYAEIPAFMARLRKEDSTSARALEWTVLNAVRTTPTIKAEWSEIDLGAKLWTIPAEKNKGGRTELRVPLSDRAIEILDGLKTEKGNPYVFIGGVKGRGLSDMAMLKFLKGHGDLTTHGFRSSFKDWASEQTSVPNEVSEAALGHVVRNETEAAYRRGDLLLKRRKLMQEWADYCASPARGVSEATPMRRGRAS